MSFKVIINLFKVTTLCVGSFSLFICFLLVFGRDPTYDWGDFAYIFILGSFSALPGFIVVFFSLSFLKSKYQEKLSRLFLIMTVGICLAFVLSMLILDNRDATYFLLLSFITSCAMLVSEKWIKWDKVSS